MLTQDKIKLVAYILVLAGAINWLGVGLQGVDYVASLTGGYSKYIYITVGVAGLFLAVVTALEIKKQWEESKDLTV